MRVPTSRIARVFRLVSLFLAGGFSNLNEFSFCILTSLIVSNFVKEDLLKNPKLGIY